MQLVVANIVNDVQLPTNTHVIIIRVLSGIGGRENRQSVGS